MRSEVVEAKSNLGFTHSVERDYRAFDAFGAAS